MSLVLNDSGSIYEFEGLTMFINLLDFPVLLGTLEGKVWIGREPTELHEIGSGTIYFSNNSHIDSGFLYADSGLVELTWLSKLKESQLRFEFCYRVGQNPVINNEVIDWQREGF